MATRSQPDVKTATNAVSRKEMRAFNIWWMAILGLYTLLMPWPFLELHLLSIGFVLAHAIFYSRKLNSIRAIRSAVSVTLYSGLLVYGFCWLLIALQIRSLAQNLLCNPYFILPIWNELWAPLAAFTTFILVLGPTMLPCKDATPRRSRIVLPAILLLCAAIPLSYAFPVWKAFAAASPDIKEREPLDQLSLSHQDSQRNKRQREIWQLFQAAGASNLEPTETWYAEFDKFQSREFAWSATRRFIQTEPQFQQAIDQYLKRQYGLGSEINSALAWQTLERLEGEDSGGEFWAKVKRVVEIVAPHLDHDQLIRKLVAADKKDWPKTREFEPDLWFDWRAIPENNELKPFVCAAWFLDREMNRSEPGQYNTFEENIGRDQFRRNAPEPVSSSWRTLTSLYVRIISGGSDELGINHLAAYVLLKSEEYDAPLCGGRESDEFLRRRWLWSLGAEQQLGSIKVKQSLHQMLFLDSLGGRKWRQDNRETTLDLARRSIAPMPKPKPMVKNKDASLAFGAIASIFSQGNKEPWPIPEHLNFLFLDHGLEAKPSVAMEFWPEFTSGIEKIERISQLDRMAMRWNYLAKLWPESSADMFVETYIAEDSDLRQEFLLGKYRESVGLPQTLPVSAQLEILQNLQTTIRKNPKGVPDGVRLHDFREHETANEIETIDHAISNIDSQAGAETYLRLMRSGLVQWADKSDGFDSYESLKWKFSTRYQKHDAFGKFHWRDDRIKVFAEDDDPLIRIVALQVIQHRPVPQYVKLLQNLTQDKDETVRKKALEVTAFLDDVSGKELQESSGDSVAGSNTAFE